MSVKRFACALFVAATVGAAVAPAAVADPGTVTKYPAGGSATRFNGMAFDTCAAPSLSQMKSWRASPYRAVGIYIGGPNRTCAQPNLTPAWAAGVTAMGWRMMPVYMGLQSDCSDRVNSQKITPSKADRQGAASGLDAIAAASGLGMQPGSVVYLDIENYDPLDDDCRKAVLKYVSGFTHQLHNRGWLAGVYANLGSGALQLANAYTSAGYARPDALWVARWDGSKTLTGLTGISDQQWSRYQRAKQYRGPHFETYDAVKLHVDSSWVNAPVATMLRQYKVTRAATSRIGPSTATSSAGRRATGSIVSVVCQASGSSTDGTAIWDKLSDGSYVSDYRLGTPSSRGAVSPLPTCFYAHQNISADGLAKRSGPGDTFTQDGSLADGALAWVTCQASGTAVNSTSVWDRIDLGLYVSDYWVTTGSRTTYSSWIPRCIS